MKTRLFLAGGGNEKDSLKIDTQFIKCLKHKRIVYIPLALEPSVNGYESCFDWISSTLSEKLTDEFVDISMWTYLKNKKETDLNGFDAVYIGGGNTYNLLKRIKEAGFDQVLIRFYKKGGIIYGGSAGAIICGYDIATVEEENEINYTDNKALNLINNYSVICHYTEIQKDKVLKYVREHKKQVIAIPERSGLIVENGENLSVVGYEPIYLFKTDSSVETVEINNKIIV